MRNTKIWLSSPHMGGTEQNFVKDAFESNWLAPLGPNVDGFEADICSFTGSKHAAALSSGTAAIHLALILLGIKTGDEVLCSSFTFSATCNPISYEKAVPVFVDSERETWNMCPNLLEEAIKDRIQKGKKPKAIILVHLYGMPAQMDRIMAISQHYDIPIIEDAAEAIGSTYHGQALGTFGEMGVYSFNGNKIITTSGGGALVSANEVYVQKAKFLATQARDAAPHYQHSEIGYNYRLSNVSAGIGRGQMHVLAERVAQRRSNFEKYKAALSQFEFQEGLDGMFSNRWLSCILTSSFAEREEIRKRLETQNIESRPLWKPMHLQPVFEHYPFYGSGTSDDLFERGLCLPSGSNLTDSQMDAIIAAIK